MVCKGGGSQTRSGIFSKGHTCVAVQRTSEGKLESAEASDPSGCERTCRLWQACHYPGKITKKVIETFDYQGEFVAKGNVTATLPALSKISDLERPILPPSR